MRKVLIAYENRQHPVEMDISEKSEPEVQKIKEVLRRVGRTYSIKEIKEPK